MPAVDNFVSVVLDVFVDCIQKQLVCKSAKVCWLATQTWHGQQQAESRKTVGPWRMVTVFHVVAIVLATWLTDMHMDA